MLVCIDDWLALMGGREKEEKKKKIWAVVKNENPHLRGGGKKQVPFQTKS